MILAGDRGARSGIRLLPRAGRVCRDRSGLTRAPLRPRGPVRQARCLACRRSFLAGTCAVGFRPCAAPGESYSVGTPWWRLFTVFFGEPDRIPVQDPSAAGQRPQQRHVVRGEQHLRAPRVRRVFSNIRTASAHMTGCKLASSSSTRTTVLCSSAFSSAAASVNHDRVPSDSPSNSSGLSPAPVRCRNWISSQRPGPPRCRRSQGRRLQATGPRYRGIRVLDDFRFAHSSREPRSGHSGVISQRLSRNHSKTGTSWGWLKLSAPTVKNSESCRVRRAAQLFTTQSVAGEVDRTVIVAVEPDLPRPRGYASSDSPRTCSSSISKPYVYRAPRARGRPRRRTVGR